MAPKTSPDEDWHEEARGYRLHVALRRRWLSCISIFAVSCVAVLLMMYSVRWRATPCQFHTNHVELVMFTRPTESTGSLYRRTSDMLAARGFKLSPPSNNSLITLPVEQHSFLDTSTRQLRESSLELRYSLRSSIEKRFPYEYMLRYISQDVCLDRPPFPLDAEYNVDEDYATKSSKAVSDTETTFYFFQSAVRSATKNKMKLANDVAVTFPSTRGMVLGGSLVTAETCQVTVVQNGRVYYSKSGEPLSLALKYEEWKCCEHESGVCRSFNAVRVVHRSLAEEVVAVALYRELKGQLERSGDLCNTGDCGVPLYQA